MCCQEVTEATSQRLIVTAFRHQYYLYVLQRTEIVFGERGVRANSFVRKLQFATKILYQAHTYLSSDVLDTLSISLHSIVSLGVGLFSVSKYLRWPFSSSTHRFRKSLRVFDPVLKRYPFRLVKLSGVLGTNVAFWKVKTLFWTIQI